MYVLHDCSFIIPRHSTLYLLLINLFYRFFNQLFFSSQSKEILFQNFSIMRTFEGLHRIDLFKCGGTNKNFSFLLSFSFFFFLFSLILLLFSFFFSFFLLLFICFPFFLLFSFFFR